MRRAVLTPAGIPALMCPDRTKSPEEPPGETEDMRPIGLGLIAALIVAMMAPATAMAAPAKAPVPAVSAEQRKEGMKDAPAIVAAANLPCQVSDARLAGKAPADKKTGSLGASVYEVACGPGSIWFLIELGFLAGTPGANRFGPPPTNA